jgi:hypothetical protein
VLYGFQRESVTSINVGKKFLVSLLVARCVREVEAHEGDEGEDVRNRQMWHVAKLRHAGVDGRYVVRAGGRGVILETETRLEATGKELVRNGGTCAGVQEKDFGPGSGATVRRAWFDFRKHGIMLIFAMSMTEGSKPVKLATPLVVWRTCARHSDRLFWVRGRTLCSERVPQPTAAVVYFKLNGIKPNKTDRKIYFHGKYISPTGIEFAP